MNTSALFEPARKKARIEIIPLIDVIFFLLATFVLFTLSLDKITMLKVPLPKAGEGKPDDTMLFIQATDAGIYWKQGPTGAPELITAAEIPARLEHYKTAVSTPRIMIRGDGKAKFGTTVGVLDLVRAAGIEQVSVETLVSRTGS